MPLIYMKGFDGHIFVMAIKNTNSWALKHHKAKIGGPLFPLMVIIFTEGIN